MLESPGNYERIVSAINTDLILAENNQSTFVKDGGRINENQRPIAKSKSMNEFAL